MIKMTEYVSFAWTGSAWSQSWNVDVEGVLVERVYIDPHGYNITQHKRSSIWNEINWNRHNGNFHIDYFAFKWIVAPVSTDNTEIIGLTFTSCIQENVLCTALKFLFKKEENETVLNLLLEHHR